MYTYESKQINQVNEQVQLNLSILNLVEVHCVRYRQLFGLYTN